MKEQMKDLRVRIDGLSQLVKGLNPQQYVINSNSLPVNKTLLELIEDIRKSPIIVVDGDVDSIKPIESHELLKCYDSLILAKAWLGKLLGELGEETPYANDGKRKDVKDIEPTADKKGFFLQDDWYEKNHIEKVDWLRQEIEKLITNVKEIPVGENVKLIDMQGKLPEQLNFKPFSREFAIARTNSYNHLSEARFWLGFELQKIKENEQTSID